MELERYVFMNKQMHVKKSVIKLPSKTKWTNLKNVNVMCKYF